jgi:hypothetical protein
LTNYGRTLSPNTKSLGTFILVNYVGGVSIKSIYCTLDMVGLVLVVSVTMEYIFRKDEYHTKILTMAHQKDK